MSMMKNKLREVILIAVIILIGLAATLANNNFLTEKNLSNILQEISTPGIMAIGMMLIIATGNIDLSIGSVFYAVCVISAKLCIAFQGEHGLLIMLIALVIGTMIGFLNGVLVAKLRIPAIVVTLATMNAIRGITLVIIDGAIITGLNGKFVNLAAIKFGPLFIGPLICLILFALTYIMLYRMTIGRKILAVGDNPMAAARIGISKEKIYVIVFAIIGLLAGIAGPLYTSKLGTINTVVGVGYEMKLIAAVVIGGTAFSGGRTSLLGTFCGIALVSVSENMLIMMRVPIYWQQMTTGAILLIAVVSSAFQLNRARRTADNDNDNKDKAESTEKGVSENA